MGCFFLREAREALRSSLSVRGDRQTGQEAPGAELAQVSLSSGEEPDGSQGGAWEELQSEAGGREARGRAGRAGALRRDGGERG